MKILLVSYFFSPVTNAGAIRWAAFVEGLKKRGHEVQVLSGPWKESSKNQCDPVVYVRDNLARDSQYLKKPDTLNAKSFFKGGSLRRTLKKLVPSFLFIDGKILWSLKIFMTLISMKIKGNLNADIVLVTGTPWSSLPATSLACRIIRMPYCVDFRDLWATDPFVNFKAPVARRYFQWIEARVVGSAKAVFAVNRFIQDHLLSYKSQGPVVVLSNGYQGDLAWTIPDFNQVKGKEHRILYAGSISYYHGLQSFFDHVDFDLAPKLTFLATDYIGAVEGQPVQLIPALPPQQADAFLQRAGVVLLTLSEQSNKYTTAKLMSYLKAGRPILYYGPLDSPAARIISDNNLGWVVACGDRKALNEAFATIKRHFTSGEPFQFQPRREALKIFSIDRICQNLEDGLSLGLASKVTAMNSHRSRVSVIANTVPSPKEDFSQSI